MSTFPLFVRSHRSSAQRRPGGGRVFRDRERGLVSGLWSLLLLWQERLSQRAALRSLSDHHLKDMGLSRADAEGEAGKPFWRD